MNKSELDYLIDTVDAGIKNFSKLFATNILALNSDLAVTSNLLNERTLANFATNFLDQKFRSNYTVTICVNELNIKMPALTQSVSALLNNQVDNQSIKREWKDTSYVDAYFNIVDLHFSNNNHLFIEYKLENRFDFTQLAQDYLKYKIYTSNSALQNSLFAYVIFSKNISYPTVLTTTGYKFVLLAESITKASINPNDKVFIYVPSGTDFNLPRTINIYPLLDKINSSSKGLSLEEEVLNGYGDLKNNIFYKNIGVFKSNVVIANIIINSYGEIKNLYNKAKLKPSFEGIFDELLDIEHSSEDSPRVSNYSFSDEENIVIIKYIKEYFKNFETHYSLNNKIEASKKGLNVFYKSSLSIIVILKIFAELNEFEFEPILPVYNKDKKNEINYNQISEDLKNEKLHYYFQESNRKNFDQLGFGVLYFICNLFEKIVDSHKDGSYKLNDLFLNCKKISAIQNGLDLIKKEINMEEELNVTNSDFRNKSLSLVEKILNYTSSEERQN